MVKMDDEQKNLRERFRDRPDMIASYLTDAFAENDLECVTLALNHVLRAQNVQALAREAGLGRETLYKSFGGKVDPQLGRLLKLFAALNVRFEVVPMQGRPVPSRPKLGRPRKKKIAARSRREALQR
jgi:probable addiction module antidote protein